MAMFQKQRATWITTEGSTMLKPEQNSIHDSNRLVRTRISPTVSTNAVIPNNIQKNTTLWYVLDYFLLYKKEADSRV